MLLMSPDPASGLPQSHTRAAVGRWLQSSAAGHAASAFRFLREAAKIADAEGSGWQGIAEGSAAGS